MMIIQLRGRFFADKQADHLLNGELCNSPVVSAKSAGFKVPLAVPGAFREVVDVSLILKAHFNVRTSALYPSV